MPKRSAGLLMYRANASSLEVFLVHPGGPFWAARDKGAWFIPKGEYGPGEDPLDAAQREFREETGFVAREPFLALGTIRQAGGKVVSAWAFAGDCNPATLISNRCQIEWPPRSGEHIEIPEMDQGRWFRVNEAYEYISKSQSPLLDNLLRVLHHPPGQQAPP